MRTRPQRRALVPSSGERWSGQDKQSSAAQRLAFGRSRMRFRLGRDPSGTAGRASPSVPSVPPVPSVPSVSPVGWRESMAVLERLHCKVVPSAPPAYYFVWATLFFIYSLLSSLRSSLLSRFLSSYIFCLFYSLFSSLFYQRGGFLPGFPFYLRFSLPLPNDLSSRHSL